MRPSARAWACGRRTPAPTTSGPSPARDGGPRGDNMRTRLRWLLAAVAVVTAGVVLPGTATAESNGGVRVMPLGDSITDGVPAGGGYRVGLWQRVTAGGYQVDFVGSQSNGPATLGDHDHE